MTNPDNSPPPAKEDWQGFRELDRAIAENRLTAYSWKKTWADPWGKAGLILFAVLFLAFVIYVVIYDGLL
ncbi:hypothetical protein [Aurantiacibacter poecillastricola]|uniref:hypothetical protein n=1 Tax=Aurantiacibacter poecillastricola TaxID=3064385 RepID=UPI00273E7F69|nr:hypothetical protein [Aurantiacibacter sp. 219JJ12-13]MDP5263279.1 hypothetical protein [Aurantiacibacter sp. 219JJ12-13]